MSACASKSPTAGSAARAAEREALMAPATTSKPTANRNMTSPCRGVIASHVACTIMRESRAFKPRRQRAANKRRMQVMALAVVVTLEKDLPEAMAAYAKASPGRALARESDRLDSAARRCGVTAPTAMLSESHAALIAQLQSEGFDPSKM